MKRSRKKATFCALYHRKEGSASELPKSKKPTIQDQVCATAAHGNDLLFSETDSPAGGAGTQCKIVVEPDALGEDMMKYARECRISVNAGDDQDVLLAIVWVLPHAKHLFRAYPEVMIIDGTH